VITSESIAAIAAALAKAQAEMGNAIKDRTNPAFRSTYADLASVREAVTGPLSANGIAVVQAPGNDGDSVTVETRLLHTSGEWIGSVVSARPAKNDPQAVGSAITYLRRYGLMAMTGIAPDDDDGQAATNPAPAARVERPAQARAEPSKAPPAPAPTSATPERTRWPDAARAAFCAELGKLGIGYDDCAEWCESLGRPRPSTMTPDERSKLIAALLTPATKAKLQAFIASKE
jgi:hypothetical protein